MNIYLSLLIMCGTVYMIRLLPLLFLRKPITNRFIRSFLFYVPYVTLAVMTGDLFVVAISCCATVFLTGLFL